MSKEINEKPHYINEYQFKRLRQWANRLCGFYAGQAYLVGSALKREQYRDVDIVFVITDSDFEMRYGTVSIPEQILTQFINQKSK